MCCNLSSKSYLLLCHVSLIVKLHRKIMYCLSDNCMKSNHWSSVDHYIKICNRGKERMWKRGSCLTRLRHLNFKNCMKVLDSLEHRVENSSYLKICLVPTQLVSMYHLDIITNSTSSMEWIYNGGIVINID